MLSPALNPQIDSVFLYDGAVKESEPAHAHARAVFVLSGDLSLVCADGKPTHLGPGAFLYLPAGAPAALRSKRLRAVVARFGLTLTGEVFPPFDTLHFVEDFASERETFLRMADVCGTGAQNCKLLASALLKEELVALADTVGEDALPVRLARQLDSYIAEHINEEISNTEIGAVFGYHPFYISQMLKSKLGITLRRYVINFRLRLACEMLTHTDKSVAAISEAAGFSDASYFTKTFKAEMGVTPKDYRNEHAEEYL